MNTETKILNLGSCNIDHVYQMPHMVKPGETLASTSYAEFPGGKGLNQSIATARAGANPYHGGCIGSDGEFLRQLMEASGVDTTYLETVPEKNGHAIIQVDETGQNSIFLYGGSNEQVTPARVDRILEHFSAGDLLLLQNEISSLDYIVAQAARRGLRIVLNPSPFHPALADLDLGCLYMLILNEIEAACFTGESDPERNLTYFRERYPNLRVLLTLGRDGSVYSDRETTLFCPAFSVKAVDTTSAGDTYTGYFLAMHLRGIPPEESLRIAAAASALAVSKAGAASSIPTLAEVEAALPNLKPATSTGNQRQQEILDRYLAEHLADASLDALAELLGYSRSYASIRIKQDLGMTFSDLIKKERCRRAAKLLATTDLAIQEIIRTCGYQNESFFRKAFRNEYQKNPNEYRKFYQNKKKEKE